MFRYSGSPTNEKYGIETYHIAKQSKLFAYFVVSFCPSILPTGTVVEKPVFQHYFLTYTFANTFLVFFLNIKDLFYLNIAFFTYRAVCSFFLHFRVFVVVL